MGKVQLLCLLLVTMATLLWVKPSSAAPAREQLTDFFDWMLENYRSYQNTQNEAEKRALPWYKNRGGCGPYDLTCNNPWSRTGKRK